jgi:hypothetical protein
MISSINVNTPFIEGSNLSWNGLTNDNGRQTQFPRGVNFDSFQNGQSGAALDQALTDIYRLADGQSQQVLDERLNGFTAKTFNDANFNPVAGPFEETYQGIPYGNNFTDVYNAPDNRFKVSVMESRIQYVLSYLMGILEQGPEGIAGLLRQRGMPEAQAQAEAMRLVNEIQRKAPEFVAAAQRAVRQMRARIDGINQLVTASESRKQQNDQAMNKVISGFGGGGGGGG